jgi:hypothetical protein
MLEFGWVDMPFPNAGKKNISWYFVMMIFVMRFRVRSQSGGRPKEVTYPKRFSRRPRAGLGNRTGGPFTDRSPPFRVGHQNVLQAF